MNCTVTCKTPVHIGTGDELQPYEYEVRNGKFLVFDQERALNLLARENRSYVEQYADYVSAILLGGRDRDGQTRRLYPSDAGIAVFCEKGLRRHDLAARIRETCVVYSATGVTWRPAGKYRQVRRAIRTAAGLFVPGSSLKGAIRTAVAYDVLANRMSDEEFEVLVEGGTGLDGPGLREQIRRLKRRYEEIAERLSRSDRNVSRLLEELRRQRGGAEKHIGETVERLVFRWGRTDKEGRLSFKDPQQDLFRAFRVSDSYRQNAELTIAPLVAATPNRQARSGAPIVVEAADVDSQFELTIDLDAGLLQRMAFAASRDTDRKWVHFAQKFRWVYGRDPAELEDIASPEGLDKWAEETLRTLLSRVTPHSRAILERDRNWVGRFVRSRAAQLEQELVNLASVLERSVLVRLGFAGGWHSTTVALALASRGYNDLLADLLYVFLMDLPQNQVRLLEGRNPREFDGRKVLKLLKRHVDAGRFPSSRRVLVERDALLGWLGWVELAEGTIGGERRSRDVDRTKESEPSTENMTELVQRLKARFEAK